MLRANLGSADVVDPSLIGPLAVAAYDPYPEHVEVAAPSLSQLGEWAGATDLGDGSTGAVGDIATALYDTANLPVDAAGLPQLESLPDATVAIYLDFDGYGDDEPFDVDDDNTTFNATEQDRIWETWRQVAAFYSAFDANVTTIEPDFDATPTNYELISNSISGGYSYLVFPSSNPRGFNQSGDAPGRTSGIIHEIGHNFGLHHQSTFGADGEETRDYSKGDSYLEVPSMGVDYSGKIHRLFIGHTSNASDLQDDVRHVQERILEYVTHGGDGFRGDDHSNTTADATQLVADGLVLRGSGIIERRTDVDAFSYSTTVDQTVSILVTPERSSPVDVELELYDSDGNLVASSDQREHFEEVFFNAVADEVYTLMVSSHGDYGEIGSYEIVATPQADQFHYTDLVSSYNYKNGELQNRRGNASHDSLTGNYVLRAAAGDIWGTNDDMTFAHRTLVGDGQITVRVDANTATHGWSKAGVMIRESTDRDSKHAFMTVTGDNGYALQYRTNSGGSSGNQNTATGDELGGYVRLTRTGDTFTGEYSDDAVTWTELTSRTIPMNATVEIGLAYTNQSSGNAALATFSELTITGDAESPATSGLSAPSNLVLSKPVLSAGIQAALTATWSPVAGAVGYLLATSLDNFTWETVAETDANTTSHTSTGLDGDRRLYAKVTALDSGGLHTPASDVVSLETRPGAVTNLELKVISDTEIVLDWREANGEIGYRIERSVDGLTWGTAGEVGAQVPSFTDSGLQPETEYHYRIISLDDASPGVGEAATSPIETTSTRFAALADLTATNIDDRRVELNWSDTNTQETGFRIERKHELGDWETIEDIPADSESYADATDHYGRFQYRVTALHPTILSSDQVIEHWVDGASTYLRFDDSGDTLIDSGNTLADTALGDSGAVRDAGQRRTAIDFNGTDTGIDLGQSASIEGDINFTLAAWVKTSGNSDAFIFGQRDSQWQGWQTTFRFRMRSDGRLQFTLNNRHQGGDQFNFSTTETINDGQWHYVVAQRVGDVGRIFIDGAEAGSGSGPVKSLNGDIAMSIGFNLRDENQYFDGLIDEARIIDRAVTPAEITNLMNHQGPVVESVVINDGEVQRSGLNRVRVTFDQIVDVALADLDEAFGFYDRVSGATIIDVPVLSQINGKTVADFTFADGDLVTGGGLVDGEYGLSIDGTLLNWEFIGLDGNDGDEHLFGQMAADRFYRKYGDATGDGKVGLADFAEFRSAFGSSEDDAAYQPGLDYEYGGGIGLADFAEFRSRFGT